jgi:AbrB family looped-hinge helix DNA binding protein
MADMILTGSPASGNLISKIIIPRGATVNPSTTKMSSRGQVVIPEAIRDELGLAPGTQFVVVGQGDVIILKVLVSPSMKDFDGLIKKARKKAQEAGIKPSDISKAVKDVRKKA